MKISPKIICFMCDWALSEGEVKLQPNVVKVQVKCIGRIDPLIILETFARGADGVILVGCKPPECHFIDGNLYAERTVRMLRKLIMLTGLEPERLRLEYVSPLENSRFPEIIGSFVNQIEGLGSLPLDEKGIGEHLIFNLQAAKQAVVWSRLRMLSGRERKLTEKANVYGELIDQSRFDEILEEVLEEEYIRSRIYLLVKKEPLSVEEMSKRLGIDSFLVLQHVVALRRKGLLSMDRIEGYTPLYRALEVV